MRLSKSELKTLKSKLPKGYRKELHVLSGYSYSMVDQVLRGTRFNEDIIDCAFDLIELNQKNSDKLREKWKKILNTDRNGD